MRSCNHQHGEIKYLECLFKHSFGHIRCGFLEGKSTNPHQLSVADLLPRHLAQDCESILPTQLISPIARPPTHHAHAKSKPNRSSSLAAVLPIQSNPSQSTPLNHSSSTNPTRYPIPLLSKQAATEASSVHGNKSECNCVPFIPK